MRNVPKPLHPFIPSDPAAPFGLQTALLLDDLVDLQDVADLEVLEPLERDAAVEPRLDLAGLVLEVTTN